MAWRGYCHPKVESLEIQVQRCWEAFSGMRGNLERFAFVDGSRRSNLVLFHRFLADHLEAAMPVVYIPTVGAVIQGFSPSCRTPIEGLFLSADQRGRLRQVLRNALTGPVDLVLVTDSEGILGIGDRGVAVVDEHMPPVAGECRMGIGLVGQQRIRIDS